MLVFGKKVAIEYLNSNEKIYKIYLLDNFKDPIVEKEIQKRNIVPKRLPKHEFFKLVDGNHQGIILDVADYKYHDFEDLLTSDENQTIIILDHIEDPHNLGAIIRTVESANLNGIILPNTRSASVNHTVLKTSAGAANKVKIAQVTNIVNTMNKLKEKGFWIYATSLTKDSVSYLDVDFKGKNVIIIRNENKGISRLVQEKSDFVIKIPMLGKVNSLNASVATGIVIYEVLRQQQK